jgi:uncharacterized protein YbjT (DUF2867 family)
MGAEEMNFLDRTRPVLVTGATGYIGGRLIPRLLASGYLVRAMGRSLEKMACRPWASHPGIELVRGDVLDTQSLSRACAGCEAAFYLVHSMIARNSDYAAADRQAAENMRRAAEYANLKQIIYLGGLGEEDHGRISPHLRSRHEVGAILQSGPVPATVLRAAMIIGSGSASFEILRYLVDRLPAMITPRWVHTPTQPIAIDDVLAYLAGCLGNPAVLGESFDIGGPEVLNYLDLIQLYAEKAGLFRRRIFPVPVLTPGLSALWIHLVTPVPAAIARPLTEGLSIPTTCGDSRIRQVIDIAPLTCRQAIQAALDGILDKQVETCWSDAGALHPPAWAACGDAVYAGGTVLNCAYRMVLDGSPEALWRMIAGMGGDTGYYFGDSLWRLRGLLDRMAGGVGLRRGRRHPDHLRPGDALDFWRVYAAEPHRRLTLLAEMKMPGQALLDLQMEPKGAGRTELRVISRFLPRGLGGMAYWYALYPFHVWIFQGMLTAIARRLGMSQTPRPERFDPNVRSACVPGGSGKRF